MPLSRFPILLVAAQMVVATAGLATAQPAPQAAEPREGATAKERIGRYQIQPVPGGVMKLDTTTGRMSFCATDAGQPGCRLVPDDRDELEAEIERLAAEKAALADEKARLASRPAERPEGGGSILTPEDRDRLDRAFGLAGEAVRRFKGFVEELERDWGGRNEPMPDRTRI